TGCQQLTSLLLPQRHLRLSYPSPRRTHTRKNPIPHRDHPPSNGHHLQDPPRPISASSSDLADPNPRPTQDPTKPLRHHDHHQPRPSPSPRDSWLPAIHSRLQPNQPRQRNN